MASIKHAVKANEVIPKAEAREYEANSSLPLFPGRSVCIPPWQSFRAPRYAAPQAPEVKKIKAVSPGTQLVMTQWLPAQGVLIHEHWRKQYNQFVEEAAKESEDPERVLKQRAQPIVISNDTARQRNVKAVAIRKLQATKMVAFNSQSAKLHAFVAQGPVHIGRAYRLIVKLFGDYTTIGTTSAIGLALFKKNDDDNHEINH